MEAAPTYRHRSRLNHAAVESLESKGAQGEAAEEWYHFVGLGLVRRIQDSRAAEVSPLRPNPR
jgi:hypothetical protein